MKEIEYEVVTFSGLYLDERDMKHRLNDLGAQGWQVASISTHARPAPGSDPLSSVGYEVEATVILMH